MADDRLSAELAAIRERHEELRHRYGHVGGLLVLAKAKDDLPRLGAAVEAALRLHVPIPGDPVWCMECAHSFPCWTRRAITRELLGEDGQPDA